MVTVDLTNINGANTTNNKTFTKKSDRYCGYNIELYYLIIISDS